jgi:hypothetical protein
MAVPAASRLGAHDTIAHAGAGGLRIGLALVTATLVFAFDPGTTWWFPSCPLYALTGWLCPFCGSLRALHALLAGSPDVAFFMNPLTTTGAVAALVVSVLDAVRPASATRRDRLIALCFSTRGLACGIVFGMLRNMSARF